MSLDCLKDVIGITRTECECFTTPLGNEPEENWFTKSTSGLYLDELPGMPSVKALESSMTCQDDLALFYQRAIETAKVNVKDDLAIGITKRYKQASKTYIGQAGGKTFSSNYSPDGTYAGLHLKNQWIRGGVLKIKKMYGAFLTPPTTLKLYRMMKESQAMEFVKDIAVAFNANALTEVASTEVLDMDGFEYFLIYEAAGIVPKNNLTACGCGYTEQEMKKYVELVGISGNNTNDFSSWQKSGYGNGLALEIEAGCDSSNILCSLFVSDIAYKTVISNAIWFKSGELGIEKVLGSEEVNRYTMMSREYLWGKRNHFRKEYDDRIIWMVETLEIGAYTDCYVCQDQHKGIQKSGLLV